MKTLETRQIQLWPSGKLLRVSGDAHGPELLIQTDEKAFAASELLKWRSATDEERKEVRTQELAEKYADRDILCCDSSLVGALLELDCEVRNDLSDEFSWERVENLRPDPSGWTLQQCADYLSDNGSSGDAPDPNPWGMDRADFCDLLGYEIEETRAMAEDVLRNAVISNIDDGTLGGLDDWRDAVRDHSQENPAEVYEWWRVSGWLVKELREIGEAVLDNDYGNWWGRTCTGQSILQDGTLQEIAAKHAT